MHDATYDALIRVLEDTQPSASRAKLRAVTDALTRDTHATLRATLRPSSDFAVRTLTQGLRRTGWWATTKSVGFTVIAAAFALLTLRVTQALALYAVMALTRVEPMEQKVMPRMVRLARLLRRWFHTEAKLDSPIVVELNKTATAASLAIVPSATWAAWQAPASTPRVAQLADHIDDMIRLIRPLLQSNDTSPPPPPPPVNPDVAAAEVDHNDIDLEFDAEPSADVPAPVAAKAAQLLAAEVAAKAAQLLAEKVAKKAAQLLTLLTSTSLVFDSTWMPELTHPINITFNNTADDDDVSTSVLKARLSLRDPKNKIPSAQIEYALEHLRRKHTKPTWSESSNQSVAPTIAAVKSVLNDLTKLVTPVAPVAKVPSVPSVVDDVRELAKHFHACCCLIDTVKRDVREAELTAHRAALNDGQSRGKLVGRLTDVFHLGPVDEICAKFLGLLSRPVPRLPRALRPGRPRGRRRQRRRALLRVLVAVRRRPRPRRECIQGIRCIRGGGA
jgi:hypothetical protein